MKRIMNRRWFVATAFTALVLASGIWLRLSFAAPPDSSNGTAAQDSTPASSSSGKPSEASPGSQQLRYLLGASPAATDGTKAQETAPGTSKSGRLPIEASPTSSAQSAYQLGISPADVGVERQSLAAHDDETRKLIQAYRLTQDENEKARIAKALPALLAKQFDARQQVRERELMQLEDQLRKLQELHQRRAKQRDQIVEERVRQLLRDADGLGWGSDDDIPASTSENNPAGRGVIGYGAAEQKNHSNNPYPASHGKPIVQSAGY